MNEATVLTAIDVKLSALLALMIADRLPENARARSRPLDQVLRAAGMDVGEIAALMGKSRQAVYQSLDTATAAKTKRAKTPGPESAAGSSKGDGDASGG